MSQDEAWEQKFNDVVAFIKTNKRNPSKQESGGQELLYKPLDTIYSRKNRYLSVA